MGGEAVVDPAGWPGAFLVDFGAVPVGGTVERTVTFRNVGKAAVTIPQFHLPPFSTTDLPLTVEPGKRRSIRIHFAPLEVGPTQFLADAKDARLSLHLVGEGLVPPACRAEADRSVTFALSSWDPAVLEQRIDIHNTGDADCEIESADLHGAPAFSLRGLGATTIRPGEAVPVVVQFDRFGDASGGAGLEVVVNGTVLRVALEAEERFVGPCFLTTGGASLGFGTVVLGNVYERTIEIHNRGAETCPETSLVLDGERFFAPELLPALASGESAEIVVQFDPLVQGPYQGTLRIVATDQFIGIPVTGFAVESCATFDETAVDFGEAMPGCSMREQFITVRNHCSEPLVANGIDIPDARSEFKVRRRPPGIDSSGVTLEPGTQVQFTLAYVPEDRGADEGTVSVSFEGHPPIEARLLGEGGSYPTQTDRFSVNPPGSPWGQQTRFFLTNQPLDLDGDGSIAEDEDLSVELDGSRWPAVDEDGVPQWHYDVANNALTPEPGYMPGVGSIVNVQYFVACGAP